MATDKSTHESRLETQLEEVRRQIEKLKAEAENVREEARTDFRSEVEILEGKHSMLQHDLKVLRETSGEAWDSLREGIEKSREKLAEGMDHVRRHFQ